MPKPGDFFCARTKGFGAFFIQTGTRSPVNHAGVLVAVDTDGTLWTVEAEPQGAVLKRFDCTDVVWSRMDLTDTQRQAICNAARSFAEYRIGYSWLDIAALSLACFGMRFGFIDRRIEKTNRLICSQLVDRAYELAGVHLFDDGRLSGEVSPGDLLCLIDGLTPPERW